MKNEFIKNKGRMFIFLISKGSLFNFTEEMKKHLLSGFQKTNPQNDAKSFKFSHTKIFRKAVHLISAYLPFKWFLL